MLPAKCSRRIDIQILVNIQSTCQFANTNRLEHKCWLWSAPDSHMYGSSRSI